MAHSPIPKSRKVNTILTGLTLNVNGQSILATESVSQSVIQPFGQSVNKMYDMLPQCTSEGFCSQNILFHTTLL